MMNVNTLTPSLRRVLLADAIVCVISGALLVLGATMLAGLLQLPTTLLRPAGIFLLPYGALVAYVATRINPPRGAVWTFVIANTIWVVASIELLISGWFTPNALGVAFIVAQAVVVAGFATMQTMGLRQPMKAVAD